MRLRLVTLNVEDLDRMAAFYTDLLEQPPDRVEPGRLLEYEFEGALFGLYDPAADGDEREIRRGDNCVPAFKAGDEFERQRERITDLGGATVVHDRETAGHRWVVFEDPEGNRVEIYR